MSAVQIIETARAAGIELSVDGNKLLIDAASEPRASIIEELRRYKLDIVKLLRPEGRLPQIPESDRAGAKRETAVEEEARRDRFEERAAILEFDEGLPRAEAIAGRDIAADMYETTQAERDFGFYASSLAALRAKCPDFVPNDRWQQAVADATTFNSEWGAEAEAFAWTATELFGLHPVPEQPAPNYDRLRRVDALGLCWLLRGRRVIALTATEAVILCQSGATLKYRRTAPGAPATDIDKAAPGIDTAVALYRPTEAALAETINTMAQIGRPAPAEIVTVAPGSYSSA